MRSMERPLATALDVIDAFGGVPALAAFAGVDYRAAFNWKATGKFPSRFYVLMSDELERRGLSASPALWSMVESPERAGV